MGNEMGLLITLVLALCVVYLVCRELLARDSNPHVPCVHQYVCDSDVIDDTWRTIAICNEVEMKEKRLEKMRREYREWVDNCNYISYQRDTRINVVEGAA